MPIDRMAPVNFERNAIKLRSSMPARSSDHHRLWANMMVPVHGTTLEVAEAIFESGEILPYSELEPEIDPSTPSPYLTDQLDIEIGQHEYVFWNIGKTDPREVAPVYFCADPALIKQPNSFVAMRDITAYGAAVSKEAKQLRIIENPTIDIEKINQQAVKRFFESLVRGSDFSRIFAKFLAHHYPEIDKDLEYWRDVTYPAEKLNINTKGLEARSNIWAGPQLQTKGRVALSSVCAIITTGRDVNAPEALKKFPWIKFGSAKGFADHHNEAWGEYTASRSVKHNFQRSFYTNLLIRQLILDLMERNSV